MNKLPSKSLSKAILLATPLFCFILCILDSSDELSYLFVLQFLGNIAGSADIMFIPSNQPETSRKDFENKMEAARRGLKLPTDYLESQSISLIDRSIIERWSLQNSLVRGISSRWLIPIELKNTDSLLMVANISQQLKIGLGLKSNLQQLNEDQIALSSELLRKLNLQVGDSLNIKFAIANILKGSKLIEKYQSFQSLDDQVVDKEQINSKNVAEFIYKWIQDNKKNIKNLKNITLSKQDVDSIVNLIFQMEFQLSFKIKYQYKNNGLYSSTLHNVVLMQYEGFSRFLTQLIIEKIVNNKQIQKLIFQDIGPNFFSANELKSFRIYYALSKKTMLYQADLKKYVQEATQNYSLIAVATYHNRQLVYHPNQIFLNDMAATMESTPGNYQLISIYPFYKDLEGIRYFFKSVIQIFTFTSSVLYFYIMTLIMKQVYEEKQIEVGIWRTLGAGGVKYQEVNQEDINSINQNMSKNHKIQLKQKLTFREKLFYAYQMIVKIGFLYYWLVSTFISVLIYIVLKKIIYSQICQIFHHNALEIDLILPLIIFVCLFIFVMGLSISHIRDIYINPLVSTIKPIKRTFDIVKIRIIKIATFGITIDVLIIALMLIYYGIVSYYWIPVSILYNNGWLQTILFNSIFVFMIFGSLVLLVVLQSRIERFILRGFYLLSSRLNCLKMIMLKNIKAKQYKNIKMSVIIAVTFAFLLFFSSGIKIQIAIIESFIERQLGSDLVLQNYQKKTFDKEAVEDYLNKFQGVRYSWLSSNLNNPNDLTFKLQGAKDSKGKEINCKILTSNYLNSTYYNYYFPEQYLEIQKNKYQILDNGVYNGFNSIYKYDELYNNQSVGHYDPLDSYKTADPNHINIMGIDSQSHLPFIADQEQVINLAMTSTLRFLLNAHVGDFYKLNIYSKFNNLQYTLRAKVTHTLKIGPGLDMFAQQIYISEQQGRYIYELMKVQRYNLTFEKLFVTGLEQSKLKQLGIKIMTISSDHTQMFEMSVVSQSFELLQNYLNGFIALITVIMGSLSILFLFTYTAGKCKQQAQMFKMLRAIGVSVTDIRIMVFLQIFVRLLVSMINGVILGIVFSLGLSAQIEEFLMFKTQSLDLKPILIISIVMMTVFSITVTLSTRYLTQRTVNETSKN